MALSLPWLINLLNFDISQVFINRISSFPKQVETQILIPEMELLESKMPTIFLVLTPLIAGWGFWKRNRGIIVFCAWWILVILATNPNWLGLPGFGVLTNFSTVTSFYIPIGIILGCGFSWFCTSLNSFFRDNDFPFFREVRIAQKQLDIFISITLILMTLLGAAQRKNDIQVGDHTLSTRPDVHAARWISDHLDKDARFLVNSMFAFNGIAIVGTDGGVWLPLLAKRDTTQPPVPYIIEDSDIPEYRNWVKFLVEEITEKGIDHPDVLELYQTRGITHVYIGQQGGLVNSPSPMINLEELTSSPHFDLIYHQDRVWIFKINPEEFS